MGLRGFLGFCYGLLAFRLGVFQTGPRGFLPRVLLRFKAWRLNGMSSIYWAFK